MPYPLYDFAYVSNFDGRLQDLSSLAQKEEWNYKHTTSKHSLPILYNYLHYTFQRIKEENKITYNRTNDKACFNTGLGTNNHEEIFAYFVPHKSPQHDGPTWFLQSFCQESHRELLAFGELPKNANYFENPAELLYDTRCSLRKNVDHIIDENKERFPDPFRSMGDNHQLKIALDGSIDHAIKRVKQNYKTAIPQFYQGRIQLLLPLCMTNRSNADLAIVVYRQEDVYLASTCLTLDMAYNNARLLARPDTEWLKP